MTQPGRDLNTDKVRNAVFGQPPPTNVEKWRQFIFPHFPVFGFAFLILANM